MIPHWTRFRLIWIFKWLHVTPRLEILSIPINEIAAYHNLVRIIQLSKFQSLRRRWVSTEGWSSRSCRMRWSWRIGSIYPATLLCVSMHPLVQHPCITSIVFSTLVYTHFNADEFTLLIAKCLPDLVCASCHTIRQNALEARVLT